VKAEKSGGRMRPVVVHVAALAAMAGLALGASGCAGSGPPGGSTPSGGAAPPVADAPIQDAVDCRSEPSSGMMLDPSSTPDPSTPVPGRVPEGFEASAALLCVVDWAPMEEVDLAPTDEGNSEPTAQVERLEGDLADLIAALAEPDDAVPTDVMCTADLEIVPALWLEDSAGRVVPVHYPRDVCGKTKPAVHEALEALEVTAVEPWSVP
jgi:hypothetical protein